MKTAKSPVTLDQWLLASALFSCGLLAARMIVTQTIGYIFLPWNLFLAFVPYGITRWMSAHTEVVENKIRRVALLALWLLFIPNSFYIITDLFHLIHVRSAPKWFDLLLIFSFAWNGILFGIISLRRVEGIIGGERGPRLSLFLVFLVMWLNALGIYIGRFLRFNSWDVLTDPVNLFTEISGLVLNPLDNWYAWGMTGTYAVFMTLLYLSVKKMGESV
ncbi:MAG: DUF1361 domain-containing protein [Sphingobacteriales bacterium]|nr:DUF1361 domain-containing protein [Sphingobacteriales bacterium]